MRRAWILLAIGAIAPVPGARAEIVSRQAFVQVQSNGEAAVVVLLKDSESAAAKTGLRSPMPDEQRSALMKTRRREVARQRKAVLDSVRSQDVEVVHAYQSVHGFSAVVSEAGLAQLAAHPEVERIDLDAKGRGLLSDSVPQIRADRVQNRAVNGQGAVVAVLDTGIVANHPDVAGALVHEECFCFDRCCPDRARTASGPGSALTRANHGMHIAGIVLSAGAVAPVGVAPGASLIAVRVLDEAAEGHTSDWIAALDWLLTERPEVRVVNMSLGTLRIFAGGCDQTCECLDCNVTEELTLCAQNRLFGELIDMLEARGTMVFVASGNDARANALTSPGCVENAVTVGAVGDSDEVAFFSNGEPGVDILAPGVAIESSSISPNDTLVDSGTSMATAHASGVAALLLSASPGSSAEEIESALSVTGLSVRDARNGLIFPRIDAFAAFQSLTQQPELQSGGGSRESDCLLEWSFIPPAIAAGGKRPTARCVDNDLACDADSAARQCTFLLSLCFNVPDPLMRDCRIDEDIVRLAVRAPSSTADDGVERANAASLRQSLPSFPIRSSSVCGVPFTFVVPRSAGRDGIAEIQLRANTATRDDYDRFALLCAAP
jgi:subtilisin family serine protease